MITVLAIAVIGLAVGMVAAIVSQKKRSSWLGTLYSLLGGLMGAVLGAMVGVVLAGVVGLFLPTKWVDHDVIALQSFHDACGSPGRIFLVTGGPNGNYSYCTRVQQEESHRPGSIDSGQEVAVLEKERGDGVLVTYKSEFADAWFHNWGIETPLFRYEFHIPPGTFLRLFPWSRMPE